ncbi:hypothetical protein HYU10_02730 [Candidatus Woesearchaeota archaeon]|nr:hypothetical protein [Candidatus Woesearchaeota archaeon]
MHRQIGGEVSDTIVAQMVPEPSKVAFSLGNYAVHMYYFMHALFHSIEHRTGTWFEPERTDEKPLQKHSFDAAVKPLFRYHDPMPSGYLITPRETKSILVHDVGEDFGRSLIGAVVINDLIKYLFGERVGRDAEILTNHYALILSSIVGKRAEAELDEISPAGLPAILALEMEKLRYTDADVVTESRMAVSALQEFMDYAIVNTTNMPPIERDDIIDIMVSLSSRTLEYADESRINPKAATDFAQQQYERVLGILQSGKFMEADRDILMPGEHEYLASLKKTLYWHYVDNIFQEVKREAREHLGNGKKPSDAYLSTAMVKTAEQTDTAANMEYNPPTQASSINRKARIVIASNLSLFGWLEELGRDYGRLQSANRYLFEVLKASIDGNIAALETKVRLDTNWRPNLARFMLMREKARDLETRVCGSEAEFAGQPDLFAGQGKPA